MRSVIAIAFFALVAQAEEQAANTTAADDDADLNELLSNMDDETMDKVADKLIDKLLGNLTGMFNMDGKDLDTTELFKQMPGLEHLMPTAAMGDAADKKPTQEQLEAEAQAAAALAEAAAETAQVLAAAFTEAYNNQGGDNQDLLSRLLPEDYGSEDLAPHAEDVCEGRNFNQDECQAQGAGCCFWENNACWAAVDGACPVETDDSEAPATELEQLDEEAPDLATVVFVGLASVVAGSAMTYALFKPRMLTDKQLPLLTPA